MEELKQEHERPIKERKKNGVEEERNQEREKGIKEKESYSCEERERE